MEIDPTVKRIIREVSSELDVDEDIVIPAISSQFGFVINKIREYNKTKEDAPILLNYLGKFTVKKNRREYLSKYKSINDRKLKFSSE